MGQIVTVETKGDIAWVTLDNPPVNATSVALRQGLWAAVGQVDASGVRAAVLRCAGRTFVAGGDMSEFDAPPAPPDLPDLVARLENAAVPWLAALHGSVLGGGLEIAMGCAWRIALPDTRFGMPEVNVGLIPGAGGSQRLPRLVGVELATQMLTSGKPVPAKTLLDAGGLDAIVDDLHAGAIDFLASARRPAPVAARGCAAPDGFFDQTRGDLTAKATGQQSPLHNLDAVEWAAALPFSQGQPKERALHLALRHSDESRALRHAFFAQRQAARPDAIAGATPRDITEVAIVGGGLMGAGIAASMLFAGITVVLLETDPAAALAGRERVLSILDGAVKRAKITPRTREELAANLTATDDYTAAQNADLGLEAVFEDLAVKRAVFARLAATLRPDALLATNTSYLDPTRIFQGIPAQHRCLGLHFFSPAHIMQLVEIIRLPDTTPDVLASGFALAKRLKKSPVLSGICDGFIGNRMLAAYRRQADYLLADGCLPAQIDAAMRDFGMPMGPYELQDMTGLQIGWANRKRLAPTRPASERYIPIADRLCEMGRFGQRSGRGWYIYDNGPQPDPEVEAMILHYAAEQQIERQPFASCTISSRIIAALVNEGARILEEGIAERAGDVDVVQMLGYGFPRWRGGPMHYAGTREDLRQTLADITEQSPGSWTLAKEFSQ